MASAALSSSSAHVDGWRVQSAERALAEMPEPKNSSAPFFSGSVIAERSPRAKRSIGASVMTSVNSNSAIARPNIEKSIGPPARTSAKCAAKSARYAGDAFSLASNA